MDNNIVRISEIIKNVCNPTKIILFGSFAREDHSPDSDYDFLVLIKGLKSRKKMYSELRIQLYNHGESHPMDIIIQDDDIYHQLIDNPYYIYKTINREGKIVYEQL